MKKLNKFLLVFFIIFLSFAIVSCGGGSGGGSGGGGGDTGGSGGGGDTGGGGNTGDDTGGGAGTGGGATASGYGSIYGRVSYMNSKSPVAGAYVWLLDPYYYFAYQVVFTDYNGYYQINGAPAGSLLIEADDYSTWTYVIDSVYVISDQAVQKDLYIAASGGGGGGGGGGSTPTSSNYKYDSFTSNSHAVLVLSSHQKNNTAIVSLENLSDGASARIEKKGAEDRLLSNILVRQKLNKSVPRGMKDLPQNLQNKTLKVMKEQKAGVLRAKGERAYYTTGSAATFKVLDFDYYVDNDQEKFVDVTAKCYAAGQYSYVFIDVNSTSGDGGIDESNRTNVAQNILTHFETNNSPYKNGEGIYVVTRRYFGMEWNPGVDNDSRMFILISPKLGRKGLLGYFYGIDEFARDSNNPNSNEKEIIYLNDDLWAGNLYYGLACLTHEFQHLVNFNMKYIKSNGQNLEEIAINEGQSMLAEELNGFTLAGGSNYYGNGLIAEDINYFLQDTSNFEFFNWNSGSYGAAFMFMLYIYERFGENALRTVTYSADVGADNLSSKLGISFDELFREWCLVNYYTQLGGNPVLPSKDSHTRYSAINTKGSYTCYAGRDNCSAATVDLAGITFAESFGNYPSNGDIPLGKYNAKYVEYASPGYTFNLQVNYSSGEADKLHSNFIKENSGSFIELQ